MQEALRLACRAAKRVTFGGMPLTSLCFKLPHHLAAAVPLPGLAHHGIEAMVCIWQLLSTCSFLSGESEQRSMEPAFTQVNISALACMCQAPFCQWLTSLSFCCRAAIVARLPGKWAAGWEPASISGRTCFSVRLQQQHIQTQKNRL